MREEGSQHHPTRACFTRSRACEEIESSIRSRDEQFKICDLFHYDPSVFDEEPLVRQVPQACKDAEQQAIPIFDAKSN